jgi:N-acetylmuramidase/Putative peptidoglycan binding domain
MTDSARGVLPARDTVLLETYLYELGYLPVVDGKLDADLTEAVRRFQREQGLVVDGKAGEKTWTKLFAGRPDLTRAVADKWLSRADLESTAEKLGLPVPTVRAVYKVESGGSGFWALRPKILFEGHVFWRQLEERGKDPAALQTGFEEVLYPKWDRTKYVGGPGEYLRLEHAQQIDSSVALESASWGLFQIMGYHAVGLGYGSVETFVEAMREREGAHLDAFGRFIERTRFRGRSLVQWLQERNWARFAEGYNGSGFKQNKYDEKLQRAYDAALAEG